MADRSENSPNNLNNIDGEVAAANSLGTNHPDADAESKRRRTQTPSPNIQMPMQAFQVAASPPKFISFEQLMAAANGVKNMTLAHEIAVNNEFQLEKMQPEVNSIEKQVRDTMHKAFWDSLEAKLSQTPPDYSHALVLIQEVKENLLSLLLPQHVRLRTQVEEVLDMELIKQKMENDAFDIFFYAKYVTDTMARLCAPVRDDRVAALKNLTEVVPLFREIFDVLDLMKMDMANFTIQQIRPYLQQQSVEYERQKFNEFLKTQDEHGTDGLEMTKQWLKRNYEKLLAEEKAAGALSGQPAAALPSSALPSSSSPQPASNLATPANILNEAYMETLQLEYNTLYPESLLMDRNRFIELAIKGRLLTTIAAIQLVTYSTVGAPIAEISSLKTTLKTHVQTILEDATDLKTALEHIGEQVKKDVNECLVQHGHSKMDDQKAQSLQGQICDLAVPTNTIMKLMKQRMMSFIKDSISITKRVDPLKVPTGFTAVESELSQLLGQFLRLISHNRSVFGPHYSKIISELLEWQQDLSPRE